MADIDELIRQNLLKEEAVASPAGVAPAEPSGGLLSRIGNFIGGSDKPDTLDASGLTQADRRQSLFAGLSDIGAKLMAAGEPMWGAQRAGILASMGNVPANMQQMRSGIAQQKLLGVKSAQAMRELQVQREMDAIAKDPSHPIWKQFQGQDLALAQWAMRTGGAKGFMEFLAHKDDAKYKAAMAAKAMQDVAESQATAAMKAEIIRRMGGAGGTQPAVPGQPPPAVPAQPPAQPSPPGASTAGSLPPFNIPGMPQAAVTPEQQTLMASAPPTAGVGGAEAAAASELMQGGGEGGGGEPPASIMRLPKPGVPTAPTSLPPVPIPPPPAQAQTPQPPQPQPQPPVSNQDIPRAPRTLEEVGQVIPPAQLLPLMGLKGNEFFTALEKLVAPGMTPVFDSQKGELVNIPSNRLGELDPRRFRPAAAAEQAFQEKEFVYKKEKEARDQAVQEVNSDLAAARQGQRREKQADGTYKLVDDPQAQDRIVDIERRKAEADAAAKQIPQERKLQAQRLAMDQWRAGVRPNETTGVLEPDEQAQKAQAKIEELKAAGTAPIEVHRDTAKQTYKDYLENRRPAAIAASNQIPLIIEAQELVKKGIQTGTFGEFRLFASQFAETLHMSKMTDAEIRTRGFDQVVQKLAVELLQSKALGSGNSITDTDLKFALNMIQNSKGNLPIIERALAHLEGNARRTIENHQREHDAYSQDSYLAPSMKALPAIAVPDRDKVVEDLNKRWAELNQPATPGLSPKASEVQRKHGPPRRP